MRKEGGKEDKQSGDLRKGCLRTYPACINKLAAERTETQVQTVGAACGDTKNKRRTTALNTFVEERHFSPAGFL